MEFEVHYNLSSFLCVCGLNLPGVWKSLSVNLQVVRRDVINSFFDLKT
jgi:hypothetical protein